MSDDEIFKKIGIKFLIGYNQDLSKWKWDDDKIPTHEDFNSYKNSFASWDNVRSDYLSLKYPPQFNED
jgi:hypothetical protein